MNNGIAKVLKIIGLIEIIGGIILGLIFGTEQRTYSSSIDGSTFIIWSSLGFVSGMIFIGFSEIIELLHSINSKLKGTSDVEEATPAETKVNVKKKDSKYEIWQELKSKDKEI